MSFSMNQAKNWFRWASQKKREARDRGESVKVPRTIGRRGLVGNAGQATTQEIAEAVYEENLAREEEEEQRRYREYLNARANGYSPTMMMSPPKSRRPAATINSNRHAAARNLPMKFTQAGIYGGKSRRQTRRNHKRARTYRRR